MVANLGQSGERRSTAATKKQNKTKTFKSKLPRKKIIKRLDPIFCAFFGDNKETQ